LQSQHYQHSLTHYRCSTQASSYWRQYKDRICTTSTSTVGLVISTAAQDPTFDPSKPPSQVQQQLKLDINAQVIHEDPQQYGECRVAGVHPRACIWVLFT
jgi:hypothetical protein